MNIFRFSLFSCVLLVLACASSPPIKNGMVITPKWKKGEVRKVRIRVETLMRAEGNVPKPGREAILEEVEYEFVIELQEKKKDALFFLASAEYLFFKQDNLSSYLFQGCKEAILPHLEFRYKTDSKGKFLKVLNWEEIQSLDKGMLESIYKELSSKVSSPGPGFYEKTTENFISRENIESEFIQKIKTIHAYYGIPISEEDSVQQQKNLYVPKFENPYLLNTKTIITKKSKSEKTIKGIEIYKIEDSLREKMRKDYIQQSTDGPPDSQFEAAELEAHYKQMDVSQKTEFAINYKNGDLLSIDNTNIWTLDMGDKIVHMTTNTAYRNKK